MLVPAGSSPVPSSAPRTVIIAIGGPSSSGKTTLAKHLNQILPQSAILHQDDFAPPAELVPIHPVHHVQDWDDAAGAIDWPRQRSILHHARLTGSLPPEHSSHDHLNEQIQVPIPPTLRASWKSKFEALVEELSGGGAGEWRFILVDGFLMFEDDESTREFDCRFFVRESYEVLKARREERQGYATAEGLMWRDPPNYWDNIVWPAYLSAHRPIFENGNIETGPIDAAKISGVTVLEASEMGMEEMVERACGLIYEYVRSGKTARDWSRP